jgi:cobaltochelatase CobT
MTRAMEQALMAMARCRKNSHLESGRVDLDRLVHIAKSLSKEVFFDSQHGKKLNVAVAITIDESGSMGNFYNVQLLAMAIGEALNAINVPFEIIGSTTKYASGDYNMPRMNGFSRVNPIIYKHYKDFADKWIAVRQRIVHSYHYNHNVDGEVVEYAAFRLAQRKEARKVVFSLSDGSPCAGHNNDYQMGVNLKRVCDRTRKNGIEVYGFGIGTDAPKQYYGEKFFVSLADVQAMGCDFVREFVKIVTLGKVRV